MRHSIQFPVLAIGGGAAAFILRFLQLQRDIDPETGLLSSDSLFYWLLPVLFLVFMVLLAVLIQSLPKGKQAPDSTLPDYFQSSDFLPIMLLLAGIVLLGASGILETLSGIAARRSSGTLPLSMAVAFSEVFTPALAIVEGVLTVLSAICLFPLCIVCHRAKRSNVDVNGNLLLVPPLALMVRLVLAYRVGSIEPTLALWYVDILSLAALILSLFWLSSFSFQAGRPRRYVWMAVMTIILCAAALAGSTTLTARLLYGGALLLHLGLLFLKLDAVPAR